MNVARLLTPASSRYSPEWYSGKVEILPVRVIDIILDSSHPEYEKYDFGSSIGAIKYSLIDRKVDTIDTKTLPVAFPINRFFTNYPLKNEIVFIVRGPKNTNDPSKNKFLERVDYYMPVVGIFNEINYIPFPDNSDPAEEPDPSYNTEERFEAFSGVRPLHPYNGDVILQGRNGQSIRLSGAISKNNTLTDDSNAQEPFTIISNGHEDLSNNVFYIENINRDKSSIYLTSDHIVPLIQSKVKYGGAKKRPILSDKYKGAQIVVNSGRLFFNSHTDDIQFTSTTDFGVSAKAAYIDAEDYVSLDAEKIYLGEKAKQFELQPVILGDQLERLLRELLDALQRTGKAMTKAKTVDAKPIPLLNLEGAYLEAIAKGLNNRINPGGKSILKSETTFTE